MTNLRCLRSICPGRKKIPEKEEDPRKDPSTQMCARNRQKSFLPQKNLQAEMSRSLSRTHVDRVTITKLFRRRLSADKCRGTPMWIGLSSQVLRGRVSETWAHNRYPPRMRMLSRSWIPSRRSDHPSRGLSVVSSPQLLRDEDLYRGRFPSGGNAERKLTTQIQVCPTIAFVRSLRTRSRSSRKKSDANAG